MQKLSDDLDEKSNQPGKYYWLDIKQYTDEAVETGNSLGSSELASFLCWVL